MQLQESGPDSGVLGFPVDTESRVAFAKSSAHGMLSLAARRGESGVWPSELSFWREFADAYFAALDRIALRVLLRRRRTQCAGGTSVAGDESGTTIGGNVKGVLIGAGFFAQFQAEAWKRIPDASLVAVADLAPGRAKEFAATHDIARAYESVEAILDAERPDFVDIATRPDTHLPLTRMAAQRGIHVICQKPMAPTASECVAMCEACEQGMVRLLIHENWRWQPWYREARRLIDAGTLGALKHFSFYWRTGDGNGPQPYAAQPYFREMPRLLIHESLIHILDTFRFLGGELRVTDCEMRRVNPVVAGEDWAEIRCAFASGAKGFIHGDRQTGPVPPPVAMGSMILEGDRATLRVASDGLLFLTQPGAVDKQLFFTPTTCGYKGDSVFATQQHLLECLRTGSPSESDGREYLKTVALVEACYALNSPTHL